MAALEITPALAEIIASPDLEVPAKLRCAICSTLAVNAYRLPCCDQAICARCHSTLATTCPVCEHSPISAADCKPNKSLRTTIKVFLRTEEKKREAARLKEAKKETPPQTPVDPILEPEKSEVKSEVKTDVQPDIKTGEPVADDSNAGPVLEQTEAQHDTPKEKDIPSEADQDVPHPSIEEIAPGQEPRPDEAANEADDSAAADEDGHEIAEKDENDQSVQGENSNLGVRLGSMVMPTGMAFGDMNQMQQMQMMMSMQNGMASNGMAPNAFGAFPMMGMPGMTMDPMAMQQMMIGTGFGGAGMGMNGMNMGMGMGGFDGGAGTGFNNGWNNQQSWNVGQDNYNHPNASGMGRGDYGPNNSGYPQSSGYNQGNYGRGGHYNNYQNNGYQARGGRGRGGYGRGSHGYGFHDTSAQHHSQQAIQGQHINGASETSLPPTGPKAKDSSLDPNVDEFGREKRQVSESESKEVAYDKAHDTAKETLTTNEAAENGNGNVNSIDKGGADAASESVVNTGLKQIQIFDDAEGKFNSSYNAYGQNYSRNGYHGRGASFSAIQPPKSVDVPINAPTGPKAMREGLPNTGLSGLKARGFSIAASTATFVDGSTNLVPEPAPSVVETKDRERSGSPSRDRRRSKSRDRHRRRHRHRSNSAVDYREEHPERCRERRKRHCYESEEEREDPVGDDKVAVAEITEDRVEEARSRSASPSGSKRSSHRNRRDRDKERERGSRDKYRERDGEKDYRSSHKHRSSRRYHDERSRSRDRDRDRDRHRERERDRDREHRRRHSRRRASEELDDRASSKADKSIPPTPIDTKEPSHRPSTISIKPSGLEIKGASGRNAVAAEEGVVPTDPRGERTFYHRERDCEEPREKEKRSRHHEDDRYRSSRHQHEREKDRRKDNKDRPREKELIRVAPAPAQDPHTLEREARNRERLLKEAQRMAVVSGGGRKRSRDDGDTKGGVKRRGRGHENEEARLQRLENERESARWA
ncbi:pre-mRNA-splicing factor 38B [Calycina marina]|uniref:Pre-mRNA-splicing factor 38B n=1 Tax=Calycina marina TaxID=1763456 RepID=A0A9P7YZ50_9HELO|nr:pre-mRNA-splicing factor 38B [Calycina marina]